MTSCGFMFFTSSIPSVSHPAIALQMLSALHDIPTNPQNPKPLAISASFDSARQSQNTRRAAPLHNPVVSSNILWDEDLDDLSNLAQNLLIASQDSFFDHLVFSRLPARMIPMHLADWKESISLSAANVPFARNHLANPSCTTVLAFVLPSMIATRQSPPYMLLYTDSHQLHYRNP